jgi:hypothetical protein
MLEVAKVPHYSSLHWLLLTIQTDHLSKNTVQALSAIIAATVLELGFVQQKSDKFEKKFLS